MPRRTLAANRTLISALCPLFIEVARVDASIVQAEVRVMRTFFEAQFLGETAALNAVRLALKRGLKAGPQDIAELATAARAILPPRARVALMKVLYELALVDGALQKSEQVALRTVSAAFNLSDAQVERITAQFLGPADRAYTLLEVTASASDAELKRAYRRLAALHHPDRAGGNSARFQQITDAYQQIRQKRGL